MRGRPPREERDIFDVPQCPSSRPRPLGGLGPECDQETWGQGAVQGRYAGAGTRAAPLPWTQLTRMPRPPDPRWPLVGAMLPWPYPDARGRVQTPRAPQTLPPLPTSQTPYRGQPQQTRQGVPPRDPAGKSKRPQALGPSGDSRRDLRTPERRNGRVDFIVQAKPRVINRVGPCTLPTKYEWEW